MDETQRLELTNIPLLAKADVLVAGGGLAGISAAIAAARAGAKTILIERNGFVGGVATAGHCCSVFNCLYNKSRNLMVKGIPLEIVELLSVSGGPGESWHKHKGHIIYDVEKAKLNLLELLEQAGVQVFLDTPIVEVSKDMDTVQGLFVATHWGISFIKSEVVIDATGDADAAVLAGAPCHTLSSDSPHRASYVFRLGNVDLDEFVAYFRENPNEYPGDMDIEWDVDEAIRQYDDNGTFLFPHGGGMQLSIVRAGIESGEFKTVLGVHDTLSAMQMHGLRATQTLHIITGFTSVPDLDSGSISKAMLDGQRVAQNICAFFKAHMPGFRNAFVASTADDLGIRVSRWIDGDFVFTKEMKNHPFDFPDTIGRGVIETHYIKNKAENAWSVQAFSDEMYHIPLRCLIPKKIKGLIMGAGRSVSAQDPGLLRVMVTTMVVGQGAGVAAAVSAANHTAVSDTPIDKIQDELTRQGVRIQ